MARTLKRSQFDTKKGYEAYKRFTKDNFRYGKTMGKMFRTKAGKYGCYVYINGRRSHFEEKRR